MLEQDRLWYCDASL